LQSNWETPGLDLANNMRSVATPEGKIVGYLEVGDLGAVPVRPSVWGYVHPDYRNQGIGSSLLQWGEERARQVIPRVPEHARVAMVMAHPSGDTAAKKIFAANGLVLTRYQLDMRISMKQAPAVPDFPAGITVNTLANLSDIKAVYTALHEIFQDHRGHISGNFESGFASFQNEIENDPIHDDSLYLLALDGNAIAALSLCRLQSWDDAAEGCVTYFGVRRPYRKRGLGLALLRYSFAELWKRGQKSVILGVDGSNLSGATRLYERAGMSVCFRLDVYEKELRPGVEISNQG